MNWIAYRDQWSGIANVYIDGVFKGEVNTYSSPAKAKAAMYTASGLPWGTHTITIEVAGRRGAGSAANWIWVDAFDYVGVK